MSKLEDIITECNKLINHIKADNLEYILMTYGVIAEPMCYSLSATIDGLRSSNLQIQTVAVRVLTCIYDPKEYVCELEYLLQLLLTCENQLQDSVFHCIVCTAISTWNNETSRALETISKTHSLPREIQNKAKNTAISLAAREVNRRNFMRFI